MEAILNGGSGSIQKVGGVNLAFSFNETKHLSQTLVF